MRKRNFLFLGYFPRKARALRWSKSKIFYFVICVFYLLILLGYTVTLGKVPLTNCKKTLFFKSLNNGNSSFCIKQRLKQNNGDFRFLLKIARNLQKKIFLCILMFSNAVFGFQIRLQNTVHTMHNLR